MLALRYGRDHLIDGRNRRQAPACAGSAIRNEEIVRRPIAGVGGAIDGRVGGASETAASRRAPGRAPDEGGHTGWGLGVWRTALRSTAVRQSLPLFRQIASLRRAAAGRSRRRGSLANNLNIQLRYGRPLGSPRRSRTGRSLITHLVTNSVTRRFDLRYKLVSGFTDGQDQLTVQSRQSTLHQHSLALRTKE
ncbi:hypothetical protein EVAR_79858_1 [Eumeta japonica]|uniref:Uncharacterized protein n=1 Tax=Eumeta variegata TaxID=151549 RepID=A0A4C1TZ98_EUMVA|nr:hypothetical protein EVAR_79858_1 [Eumeta japonica]